MRPFRCGRGLVFTAAAAVLLAGAPPAPGESAGFELGVQAWRSDANLEFRSDLASRSGSDIDMGSTLGLDTSAILFVPYARMGGLYVDYLQKKYEGSETLTADLNFRGQSFVAGTPVDSSMDLMMVSAYYTILLGEPSKGAAVSDFGPTIGLKYLRCNGRISSDVVSAKADLSAPVPVFGAQARVAIADSVQLTGQFVWLKLGYPLFNAEAFVLDGQVGASLILSNLSAGIGYHYFKADVKANVGNSDEIEMNMDMSGWFVSASLVF